MEGKKRYVIVALLLLLLGFGAISFAGNDDETGSGELDYEEAEKVVEEVEQNPTEESIEDALEIVEQLDDEEDRDELADRVENARPGIDPALLISNVENMIAQATTKENIAAAKDYYNDNNVKDSTQDLDDGNVKDNLDNRIDKLEQIFGDSEAPTFEGIEPGATTNQPVTLVISDGLEVTKVVTLNGEEVAFADVFTEEGTYVVTATDEAQNTNSITFTIDTTKPQVDGITSGGHYKKFTINASDESELTIEVEKNHSGVVDNVDNGTEFTEDGTYKITVTDKAGNSIVLWTAIDSVYPVIEDVADYVNTCVNVIVSDKYLFEVKINDDVYGRADGFVSGSHNENFTFEKEVCDEGTYTIVAKDKIGNEVSETFTIDTTAPTRNYSTIRVNGNPYSSKNGGVIYYHLTDGNIFEFAIAFDEILKDVPTVKIGGKEIAVKLNPGDTKRDGKRIYLYEGVMELREEDNIKNGVLDIVLSNVVDLAGNVADEASVLNQTPTSNYRAVIYDSKAPVANYVAIISKGEGKDLKLIKNNEVVRFLVAFNEEVFLPANIKESNFVLNINGKTVKFVRSQGAGYEYIAEYLIPANETSLAEGELTFSISGYSDLTGNVGSVLTVAKHNTFDKVIYDRTPVAISGVENNGTYTYDGVGVTPNTTDSDVKSVVLTKDGEVVNGYALGDAVVNAGTYKLVVTDNAGNISTTNFVIEKQQIEFELTIDSEIEFDDKEHTATVKVLNLNNELDYTIEDSYYIMTDKGTFYGPLKVDYAKEFGEYKVKVTIRSNNPNYSDSETKSLRFKVVDTTPPTLTITRNEEKNVTYVRGNDLTRLVYTIFKNDELVHTVDSATCGCGNYFSLEWLAQKHGDGEYVINVVDLGGNTASTKVMIDTTKPEVVSINKEFISNENVKVTLTFNEAVKEIDGWTKVSDVVYERVYTEYTEEVVTFKDLVNLENTYSFTVDASAPKVTASYTETTVEEDSIDEFTGFPTFIVDDNSTYIEELVAGSVNVHAVGKYTLNYKFTDAVGNYTLVDVVVNVVDTKLPIVTGVVDGEFYNTKTKHAIPVITEKNLESVKLVRNSVISDKLNVDVSLLFKSGTEILVHGNYTLTVKDKYNDPVVINFTVDTIKPQILLLDKIETITGNILPIIPQILDENLNEVKVWKDDVLMEGYKIGDQLTETANYKIYANDKAGNETLVEFNMDNERPNIINPSAGLGFIGYYREYPITIYDETNNIKEIVVFKKSNSSGILPTYNRYEVVDNTLTEEGEYIIVVYDEAYNIDATMVIIDKEKPTSNIVEGKSYKSVTPKADDANLGTVKLYKDGKEVESFENGKTVISDDGKYTLYALDKTNNIFTNALTVNFVIDNVAPYQIYAEDKTVPAYEGSEPLDLTVYAHDAVDGKFEIEPLSIEDSNGNPVTTIETTLENVGTYTVTYVATDKAGNVSAEKVITITVKKAAYSLTQVSDKEFAYTGKAITIEMPKLLREGKTEVAGEIIPVIKKDGSVVTEINEVGEYEITYSSTAYEDIQNEVAIYTVKKADLSIYHRNGGNDVKGLVELEYGMKASDILSKLIFKNQDGKTVFGVDTNIVIYKEKTKKIFGQVITYYDIVSEVGEGNYYYTVDTLTNLTDNYDIIDSTTVLGVSAPNTAKSELQTIVQP